MNFQIPDFSYNRNFMRILAIVAGLLLTALPVCLAQTAPTAKSTSSPSAQENPALHQQLQDLKATYGKAQLDENSITEVVLQPTPGRQSLDLSGDPRAIYNAIAAAFGLRASFDESVPARPVHFALQNVTFNTAMETAALMTRTFWVPQTPKEFLVASDTAQKRRELERMLERTFYLSGAATQQDIQDITNLLRTIFEIRYVVAQPGSSTITVRADQNTMHQAERLLAELDLSRQQVTLEIQAFEVNTSMERKIGVSLPLQFQMFNIPSSIVDFLKSPQAQSAIQQFQNSGGTDLSQLAALAGLSQSQVSQLQSLLANPVATFGGGITLMGIGIPPLTVNFSQTKSHVNTLEQASIQASQGNPATFHVGNRFPVLTQSFSSGLSIPGVNLGVVGAIPGFTYEDLGITLKAKPQILGTSAVTLDMELAVKSLGSQVLNSIPIIQNREYKGVITVKDGEPAVIAGTLSNTESHSLVGPPGIGSIPGLNRLVSNDVKSEDRTELVIMVTPHITRTKMIRATAPIVAAPSR